MNVLALIPARGGSKGVPRKNLRELGGRPLIAWSIEAALAAARVTRVIVSTDDDEIAAVARELGAEVPFTRPAELARDETADLPVYLHAIDCLGAEGGRRPDAVAWLRPTSPLRRPADIDEAIETLDRTGAGSVRSVCLSEYHPFWMKQLVGDRLVPYVSGADENTHPQRQLLPPMYRLNGAVDVVRCDAVAASGVLFGADMAAYVMPADRSMEIDSELDLTVAESLFRSAR